MTKNLKARKDGMVNVTLDADVVKLLDARIERIEAEIGFRPTRSQGVSYIIKKSEEDKR